MVTKTSNDELSVGDHVTVYWGLNEVNGVVVDIYGTGPLARARVRVAIPGANGEELATEEFSLPFGAIERD